MAKRIAELAAVELDTRRTGDVVATVDRIFKKSKVDLIPLRDQGGAYIVFAEHASVIEAAEEFVKGVAAACNKSVGNVGEAVQIKFARIQFSESPKNNETVAASWTNYVDGLITEFDGKIEAFDADTRGSTLERTAEEIRSLRTRISAHAGVMADNAGRVTKALESCTKKLLAKIEKAKANEATKAKPAAAKPKPKSSGKRKAVAAK